MELKMTNAHLAAMERSLLKIKSDLAAVELLRALKRLSDACDVKYDPNQPRVPAGNSEGGQWTEGGGGSGSGSSGNGGRTQTPPSAKPSGATPWVNIDRSIRHLNANAQPKSVHECAKYVRQAIEAGGVTLKRQRYAKDYGPSLEEVGYKKIVPSPMPNYKAMKGDVVVIQSYPGGSPAGHMAMYNGVHWVSDFVQRGADIWPGPGYRKHIPVYEVYRVSE
jgi:hypothetical protein